MLTRFITCMPLASVAPLLADPPPLPLDCASPERAQAAPQFTKLAVRFRMMLIGL